MSRVLLTIDNKGRECFTETDLTSVVEIWEFLDRIIPDAIFYVEWDNILNNAYKFVGGQLYADTDKMNKVYRLNPIFVQGELF